MKYKFLGIVDGEKKLIIQNLFSDGLLLKRLLYETYGYEKEIVREMVRHWGISSKEYEKFSEIFKPSFLKNTIHRKTKESDLWDLMGKVKVSSGFYFGKEKPYISYINKTSVQKFFTHNVNWIIQNSTASAEAKRDICKLIYKKPKKRIQTISLTNLYWFLKGEKGLDKDLSFYLFNFFEQSSDQKEKENLLKYIKKENFHSQWNKTLLDYLYSEEKKKTDPENLEILKKLRKQVIEKEVDQSTRLKAIFRS